MSIDVVNEDVIVKMVEVIVREVQPEQVYLFGSRARGDALEDSDVDILVVERAPFSAGRSRFAESNRIYRALAALPVPIDVLLYSTEEVAEWCESANHVIGRCLREGRLLYARP